MNGVKGRSRHEHQWVEMRRTFTGDGSVKSITGADPETIERLLFGVTSVEMMCSECGDRKSYELLGDASWPMRSCRGCVVNGDHLLHLRGVEDGRTYWRLTCHHEPGVYGATMDDEQRTPDPEWPADVLDHWTWGDPLEDLLRR